MEIRIMLRDIGNNISATRTQIASGINVNVCKFLPILSVALFFTAARFIAIAGIYLAARSSSSIRPTGRRI